MPTRFAFICGLDSFFIKNKKYSTILWKYVFAWRLQKEKKPMRLSELNAPIIRALSRDERKRLIVLLGIHREARYDKLINGAPGSAR